MLRLIPSSAHRFSFTLAVFSLATAAVVVAAEGSLRLANQRELFLDDAVLEKLHGLDVRLITPVPAGVVMTFDQPWEGRFCTFVSILQDGKTYRMYYRAVGDGGPKAEVTCYAESDDGIHWRKPKLGLVEMNGSRENNVMLGYTPKRYTHNFSVMIDDRPGRAG